MSREDDTIIPGERIGPFRIGASEAEVLSLISGGSVHREQRDGTQVMHWGSLSFWFDDDFLTQVGAHSDFGGRTPGGIGIGSTLEELARKGEIGVDLEDGVLLLEDLEGICFDVGDGLPELSKMLPDEMSEGGAPGSGFQLDGSWPITWIGVFDPERVAEVEDELEAEA